MKISSQIMHGNGYNSNLTDETKCLLYIIFFHFNGYISDAQRKGMFKSLRTGELLKSKPSTYKTSRQGLKGCYHSKINNKYYNDEYIVNIFEDIFSGKMWGQMPVFIDFDVLIKYLQLYLNRPKNYCIDYIFYQIIKPTVDSFKYSDMYYAFRYLDLFGLDKKDFNIQSYESLEHDLLFGYCCEDCDGDAGLYKASRYECYYLGTYKKEVNKQIKDFLCSKRDKGNKYMPEYSLY
jgi:hypothetical protein